MEKGKGGSRKGAKGIKAATDLKASKKNTTESNFLRLTLC
jgi:hypothetical protein